MKKQFIELLKDLSTAIDENKAFLNQHIQEGRISFDPEIEQEKKKNPHAWDKVYFQSKIMLAELPYHFTQSLITHLFDVKEKIQEEEKNVKVRNFSRKESSLANNTIVDKQKIEQVQLKPDLSQFSVEDRLNSFLAENKLSSIRTYLMNKLNSRYITLEDLVKTIYYVFERNKDVFEAPKETAFVRPIDLDENQWTEDYFSTQQVYLNQNFSLDRILHLVNVRGKLKGFEYIERNNVEPTYSSAVNVKKDEPKATLNNSSTSYAQPQSVKPRSAQSHPDNTSYQQEHSSNDFWKNVALIGGAVLAAVMVIFAIFK